MKNAKFYLLIALIALLVTWFFILTHRPDEGMVQHWNAETTKSVNER